MENTLSADQIRKVKSLQGIAILKRYCSFLQEWQDSLIKHLSDDWEGGIIASSLIDTPLYSPFLLLLNYPPSSNAGKTSRSNRTSTQVVEPILGNDHIFIDIVPVIPKENRNKDAQIPKYAKIKTIAENFRQRFASVIQLQQLIGVNPTVLIGGKSAKMALTEVPHAIALKQSGCDVWRFSNFSQIYAVLCSHPSAGMMVT